MCLPSLGRPRGGSAAPDVGTQGCTTVEGSRKGSHEGEHNNSLLLRIPLPSCSRHGAHLCPTQLEGSAQLQQG